MTQAQQLADLSQAYTAGCLGFRNRMINGAAEIAARPSLVLSSGNGYGGPDRFRAVNIAGGSFTQAQSTITYNNVVWQAVRQTVGTPLVDMSGTNNWSGIAQQAEGYYVYDLLGQPVAVAFIWLSNVTGIFNVALRDAGGYAFVTRFSATANVAQRVMIPIPAIPLAALIPCSSASGLALNVGFLNGATYRTATPDQWIAGNFLCTSDQVNWGAAVNNFISLTQLQLEPGTIVTPFERRTIGFESLLCQRYRQQNYIINYGTLTKATDTYRCWTVQFMTPMRVAPAVTATLSSGSLSIVASGVNGFTGNINIGDTTTTVQMTGWSAEAEL